MILSLEPLAYYFGMRPSEFWNSKYHEVYLYCEVSLIKIKDEFKQEIILQEAVSDKIIQADAMSSEKPKIISLKKVFRKLFDKR